MVWEYRVFFQPLSDETKVLDALTEANEERSDRNTNAWEAQGRQKLVNEQMAKATGEAELAATKIFR